MRAKFVNEIKKGNGSALGPLGIGRAGILNIPKKLKELAKDWGWNDFYNIPKTDHNMKASYKANDGIHTLTFSYSQLNLPTYQIDNPTITYDEKNKTAIVFRGGVNFDRSIERPEKYEILNLDNEKDFGKIIDGLDNEWVTEFYENLEEYIKDYGDSDEESSTDDDEYSSSRDYRPDTGGLNY
jgi:hypothetical protein